MKDYVKLWNALSPAEQDQHAATQSQLYRRATALIKQQQAVAATEPADTDSESESVTDSESE